MKITAIFMELNEELGMMQNIGTKELGTTSKKKANQLAKPYALVLEEVRNKKVSYMLSQNNGILATIG